MVLLIKMDSYQHSNGGNLNSMDKGAKQQQGLKKNGKGSHPLQRPTLTRSYAQKDLYNWRDHAPVEPISFIQWIANGVAPNQPSLSDEERKANLSSLARLLLLLREYQNRYGMPDKGGPKDQEFVLRNICKDLYSGGAPVWVLQPVMKRVVEGLSGDVGVDFFFLPRRAFVFSPAIGSSMFEWNRGFCIHRLDEMERVAIRLASFATNTNGVNRLPSKLASDEECREAYQDQAALCPNEEEWSSKESLAEEILGLASRAAGLIHFLRRREYVQLHSKIADPASSQSKEELDDPSIAFWKVEDSLRELFCRLATLEAIQSIDQVDEDASARVLYSPWVVVFFRIAASAGACAMWFHGSWYDMIVAGILALVVAFVGSSNFLSRHDRIIFEVVAGCIVGFTSGLIALQWPQHTCFGAMAIAGVLDILQGFRVVYSVIEIMSKHTVTGGADFLEGILFTSLIAFSLKFGQVSASYIMNQANDAEFPTCSNGIDERWYFLFVPLAALSWSGLFEPHYIDLPMMCFHGTLAYAVSWALDKTELTGNVINFLAAMAVTFSAGVVSRFTGRQALGNTVAGLYVLLPGAYLVNALFADHTSGWMESVITTAIYIGIGSWTGTLLCSPTLFGTNSGLLQSSGSFYGRRERNKTEINPGTMLFF